MTKTQQLVTSGGLLLALVVGCASAPVAAGTNEPLAREWNSTHYASRYAVNLDTVEEPGEWGTVVYENPCAACLCPPVEADALSIEAADITDLVPFVESGTVEKITDAEFDQLWAEIEPRLTEIADKNPGWGPIALRLFAPFLKRALRQLLDGVMEEL